MKKSSRDLTTGNILLQILLTALPILAGQLLQNLYNSVDSIVVGNYVGKTALAAVTSCNDISRLVIGFFTGLSTGAGVLFSNDFGAKAYEHLRRAIHTSLLFATLIGVVMAAAGILLSPALLHMVRCPADVYDEALLYLRIYLIGALLTSVYNIASGVLRAVGDTHTPLIFLLICSTVNIGLDLLLVLVVPLGVAGVAIATILSQLISCILVLRKMTVTEDVYRVNFRLLRLDPKILKEVLRLGLPAGLQTCFVTFSNLFLQRYVNGFGSSAMAGIGAAKKIDKYVTLNAETFGMTTAIFVAQNEGAGKRKRALKGIACVIGLNLCMITLAGTFCMTHAPLLIRIFSSDAETIRYGALMLVTIFPFYYLQMMHQTMVYTLRGFGRSEVAMLISMWGIILCRQTFLAVMMPRTGDIHYIFYSYPVGWVASLCVSLPYFYFRILKPRRTQNPRETSLRET